MYNLYTCYHLLVVLPLISVTLIIKSVESVQIDVIKCTSTHKNVYICRMAQSVKVMIAIAIFLTYSLQFYVPMEIIWKSIKHRFTKHPALVEYSIRTTLVIMTGNPPLYFSILQLSLKILHIFFKMQYNA